MRKIKINLAHHHCIIFDRKRVFTDPSRIRIEPENRCQGKPVFLHILCSACEKPTNFRWVCFVAFATEPYDLPSANYSNKSYLFRTLRG